MAREVGLFGDSLPFQSLFAHVIPLMVYPQEADYPSRLRWVGLLTYKKGKRVAGKKGREVSR